MKLFDRLASWAGYQRVPPKVDPAPAAPRPPVSPEARAWARRTMERIRDAVYAGRIVMAEYLHLPSGDRAAVSKVYREMLAEPMILTPLRVLVDAVAALDLQVLPEDPADARQQEFADFCRHAAAKAAGGRLAMTRAVFLPGVMHGWSVTEPTWVEAGADEGRWAGRWRWAAWKQRDTDLVDPVVDAYGNVTGIDCPAKRETYSPDDFILYSHLKLFEDPRGIAGFRAAYRDWYAKTLAVQFEGEGLERWGFPALVGTYKSADEQKAALEEALTNFRTEGWVTAPDGVLISAVSAATNGPGNFEAFIASREKGMLIAIMGSHLAVSEGIVPNVAGNSNTQRSTTELFMWAMAEEMAGIYTGQFAKLGRLNYAGVPCPTAVLGAVSEAEIAAMLANDATLRGMGVDLSKRSLYKRSGREAPHDDADRVAGAAGPAPAAGGPFGFADGRGPDPRRPGGR